MTTQIEQNALTLPADLERHINLLGEAADSLREVSKCAADYAHFVYYDTWPDHEQKLLSALTGWVKAERALRASEPGSRPLVLDLAV